MRDYTQPIERFLDLASILLQTEATSEAPVVEGRLRGDITVFPPTQGERSVGNTSLIDYAKYVYYGTKPHIIVPKRAKALKTPYGFRKKVKHPGTRANPYLDRALKNIVGSGQLNRLLDGFSDEMSEEIFENISNGLRNLK